METIPDDELDKREELLDGVFGEVVSDLKSNGRKASKVIVFCFLRNDCAVINEYFIQKFGNQNLVNMFTNITDDTSKKIHSQPIL